jgi:hypothetical protein
MKNCKVRKKMKEPKKGRWLKMRSDSSWHFDLTKPPEHGADSYTHICRFNYDFTTAIKLCNSETVISTWGKDENVLEPEQIDLINSGANPHAPNYFHPVNYDIVKKIKIFKKICNYLGLNNPAISFHNQTTGQMLHTHMDWHQNYTQYDYTTIRRFAIMLADWELGQIFQLGNANFTQWRAGDCITWEWKDMPHSTANMGWWDRPMLQITGFITDRTNEVLKNANKNLVVKL